MMMENEQQASTQSFKYLEVCCRFVGEKYGNTAIATWTNGDYVRLSGILSRQTHVLISPSTLKRIFGKLKTPERYYPQKATRDALAQYIGFSDWEKFIVSNLHKQDAVFTGQKTAVASTATGFKRKILSKKKGIYISIVLLTAVAAFFLVKPILRTSDQKINATLICLNSEGKNPHSARFTMKILNGNDDGNFYIRFGDVRSKHKITTGQIVTHYYEIPGRYYAVLYNKDKPVDSVSVYLRTSGWTATARLEKDTMRVYPISLAHNNHVNVLKVNPGQLSASGVDTNRTFYVDFADIKPMNVSGDNFELEADVKSSAPRPGVRCSQTQIAVYGETARHSFYMMKPGCESWIDTQFSERSQIGTESDLSTLAADLSAGGRIRLMVENKKVRIYLNDKKVFSTRYRQSIGNIYGMAISFSGIGEIRNVQLKNLKNQAVAYRFPRLAF